MICRSATALALSALIPFAAQAEDGNVDQVERLEIERGEFEVEGQFIHVESGDGDNALLVGTTFEYGVLDNLQLGIEIEAERESGESLIVEAVGLQFKWIALDPEEAAIGLGIQFAGVIATQTGDIGTETFLIAESALGDIDAAANLVIESEPGDFSEVSTAYAVRLDRAVSDRFALGVEAGGGISGEGRGSHFIGPVLSMGLSDEEEGAVLELSAFAPLSREAPDLQLRVELDLSF